MIRIAANLSKKVPLPNVQFSSQQYGASMEIEVSDADGPDAVRDRIRQLYALLNESIAEQIAEATQPSGNGNGRSPAVRRAQSASPRSSGGNGSNGGRRNGTGATQAQQRAVHAIARSLNLDVAEILAELGIGDLRDLSVKECSQLIDDLKTRQTQS